MGSWFLLSPKSFQWIYEGAIGGSDCFKWINQLNVSYAQRRWSGEYSKKSVVTFASHCLLYMPKWYLYWCSVLPDPLDRVLKKHRHVLDEFEISGEVGLSARFFCRIKPLFWAILLKHLTILICNVQGFSSTFPLLLNTNKGMLLTIIWL